MTRMPVAERRSLLIDAAWRVLLERGVVGTTTRAVCAEAGMPQGAFHYCFSGRDELLREVASGLLGGLLSASTGAITKGGSLRDAIFRALSAYWESVRAQPGAHQVLYELTTSVLRDDETADIARYQYRRYLAATEQVFVSVADRRKISWDLPVPVLARQVVAFLDGLTLHYLVDRNDAAARAALDSFAGDMARHGKRRKA